MCFLPSPFTTIGWFTVNTYSLLVALGILSGAGSALFGLRGKVKLGAAVDCLIAGLIGGVICARLLHRSYGGNHTITRWRLRLAWRGYRDAAADVHRGENPANLVFSFSGITYVCAALNRFFHMVGLWCGEMCLWCGSG